MSEELVQAVLADWQTAPIDKRMRATLGFLEKLTLRPEGVRPANIAPLREAGLSDEAIEDAIQVCALFNIIDRLADALDFGVSSAESFEASANRALQSGYRLM